VVTNGGGYEHRSSSSYEGGMHRSEVGGVYFLLIG